MDSAQHVQEEKNFSLLLADATDSYERTRRLALWAACDSRSCYDNASTDERPLRTSIWVSSPLESPLHCTAGPFSCHSTALLTSCQEAEF